MSCSREREAWGRDARLARVREGGGERAGHGSQPAKEVRGGDGARRSGAGAVGESAGGCPVGQWGWAGSFGGGEEALRLRWSAGS